MPVERLQKIIAAAGVASRRKAEELITAGRVTVNGQVITELGSKADPAKDDIRVDGNPLHSEQHVYIVLHKPKGYVTTVSDPEGRPTVMDLLKSVPQRVFPVGRVDYLSEGLLLLTNDGDLAAKLTHASTHVSKRYLVKVSGQPNESDIQRLREGVVLPPEHGHVHAPPEEGGKFGGQKRRSTAVSTAPASISLIRAGDNPWYEVTLVEGRNRQIRRMFSLIGHHVEKIRRVAYGPLELDVENGQFRILTPPEVSRLRAAASGRPGTFEPERVLRRPVRDQRPERDQRAAREQRPARNQRPEREQRPERARRPDREQRSGREQRAGGEQRPGRERRPRFGQPAGREMDRSGRERERFSGEQSRWRSNRPGKPQRDERSEKPASRWRDREERPADRDNRRGSTAGKFPGGSRFGRKDEDRRSGSFEKPRGERRRDKTEAEFPGASRSNRRDENRRPGSSGKPRGERGGFERDQNTGAKPFQGRSRRRPDSPRFRKPRP